MKNYTLQLQQDLYHEDELLLVFHLPSKWEQNYCGIHLGPCQNLLNYTMTLLHGVELEICCHSIV